MTRRLLEPRLELELYVFVVNGYRTGGGQPRFVATCPQCPYEVTRSKRDAASHVMRQHLAYAHELEGRPA